MISLLLGLAHAGTFQATLVKGAPEFNSCLESENCSSNFYQFLTHSMMEQGMSMQSHTVLSTPLLYHADDGFFAGAGVNTFPFSAPQENLSGKPENTSFSPVFPSIELAKVTADKSYSLKFLPPVPVQGASAFLLSGTVSRLWDSGDNWKRTLDTELGLIRANAPITASDEQIENKDDYGDNIQDETLEENCGDDGCIDTYYHASLEFRVGQSWQLSDIFQPYVQLGGNFIYENLFVQYDQTGWAFWSVQPMLRSGVGMQFLDGSVQTMLGGMVSPKYPGQDLDGKFGVFYTTQADRKSVV